MPTTNDILGRVSAGEDLTMEEMSAVIDQVMRGLWVEEQIGLLLTALRAKGETVAEVAGAAVAMRRHMTKIRHDLPGVIDTCGTGGDGSGTFNISTAAAIVTAAAGVPVAKHGNRGISSKSGSSDVLSALGVNVQADVAKVERCLAEVGLCFCFAPLCHGAMKHVASVRKKLGVPTIFNMLGPLCNPAAAGRQLVGVGRPELRPLLAEALRLLGTERAIVVHGRDRLDEVSLSDATDVTLTENGQTTELVWSPADFGLSQSSKDAMLVDGPEQSAELIRGVLDGRPGPPRDIVVLNSAAALWTAGKSDDPAECARQAAAAIDSGAARDKLRHLAEVSGA